jgi:hypothetical protein
MILRKAVTLQDLKELASTLKHSMDTVWYSARTAWWTHDGRDLRPGPVPLDPFGSPLYQGDLIDWLKVAEQKPEHYGEHGLNIFMASNAKNFNGEKGELGELFTSLNIFQKAFETKIQQEPSFQLLTK